jgi:hypothetical protein
MVVLTKFKYYLIHVKYIFSLVVYSIFYIYSDRAKCSKWLSEAAKRNNAIYYVD